jgi:type II secretory pathway component GspD/PulD (secretin)
MKSLCILFCVTVLLVGCKPQTVRPRPFQHNPMSTNGNPGISLCTGETSVAMERIPYTPSPEMTNLYDIIYTDAPILQIVKDFGKIANANIIARPDDLDGFVTVRLTEVEWKPALVCILDMENLQLIEKSPGSGVYSVVKKTPGAPPPFVMTVLLFTNRDETLDFANAVREIWGSNRTARAVAVPSRNAIILEGTEPAIREIERIRGLIAPDKPKK